mgnify:CR=1 FL=1
MPSFPSIRRFTIGPVVVDTIDRRRLRETVDSSLREGTSFTCAYVNAHVFGLLHRDAALAATMRGFDVVFCDGVGAALGLRALGAEVPERMTPPDFVDELVEAAAATGAGAYLLGDEASVVERASVAMNRVHPGAIVGHHHGFFSDDESSGVLERIRRSGARLVLVGMGTPRQERLIEAARERLPGLVWLAVGGLFRWTSGAERRGPRWLTDHGFEWLTRLVSQPRRVARRYLLGLPRFALHVVGLRLRGLRAVEVRGAAVPARVPSEGRDD